MEGQATDLKELFTSDDPGCPMAIRLVVIGGVRADSGEPLGFDPKAIEDLGF